MSFLARHPFATLMCSLLLLAIVPQMVPRPVYCVGQDGKREKIGTVTGYLDETTFYAPAWKINGTGEEIEKYGGGRRAIVNHNCWICQEGLLVSRDGEVWYPYPRARR